MEDPPPLPSGLETEHLLDVFVDLEAPLDIGAGPFGRRLVLILKGGRFTGPKLRGEVLPGGGDWLVWSPPPTLELDVRAVMRTDDGAHIMITFRGAVNAEPAVLMRVLSGQAVSPEEYYARITPRFEAGAERYRWLNAAVCLGGGYLGRGHAAFRVWRVL
jgi:hypothetical protein